MQPITSYGQLDASSYKDTVEIIDFLVSAHQFNEKYRVIGGDFFVENSLDTIYRLYRVVVKVSVGDFDQNIESILKERLGLNDSDKILFPHKIEFNQVHFLGTEYKTEKYVTLSGPGVYFHNMVFKQEFELYKCSGGNAGFSKVDLSFHNSRFLKGLNLQHSSTNVQIHKSIVQDRLYSYKNNSDIEITKSEFKGSVNITSYGSIKLTNNLFRIAPVDTLSLSDSIPRIHFQDTTRKGYYVDITDSSFQYFLRINGPLTGGKQLDIEVLDKSDQPDNAPSTIIISDCQFEDPVRNQHVFVTGNFSDFLLSDNKIESFIHLDKINIDGLFDFHGNELRKVSLNDNLLSERKNYIPWKQLNGNKIHHRINVKGISELKFHLYKNGKDSMVTSIDHYFRKLIENYKELKLIYEQNGDIESANGCYAEMKQIETRRWKQLYKQNKSFELFFRWQLNSFLSYFTDYGTNPAKAVVKSGWVILLFSIFYLFFPSDWDVSNRSQLLSKLKDLASKNREKSFLATLGFVAYSGFIHVLNALTLSLNAFTTLGFGDIPTHGAARYVTIVQGFIGWFLLTIFSVSLIHQVLG